MTWPNSQSSLGVHKGWSLNSLTFKNLWMEKQATMVCHDWSEGTPAWAKTQPNSWPLLAFRVSRRNATEEILLFQSSKAQSQPIHIGNELPHPSLDWWKQKSGHLAIITTLIKMTVQQQLLFFQRKQGNNSGGGCAVGSGHARSGALSIRTFLWQLSGIAECRTEASPRLAKCLPAQPTHCSAS